MANIFMGVPGSVAVFPEPDGVILGRIKFEGSENMMFMISGTDYKQSVDAQFQTSLERDIYAYVFGDNMGDAVVHGRVYAPCKQKTDAAEMTGRIEGVTDQPRGGGERTGLDDIMDLYAQKRLSNYFPPVTLSIGKRIIRGYLTSLVVKAVGLSDEPSGLVYDFSATINTLPSLGSGGGSGSSGGSGGSSGS